MAKLVVVGQGYVGLPVAVRACEAGFDVVGLDVVNRVERIAVGDSPVEDITPDRLRAALDGGRYRPSCDWADCVSFDDAIISVPTPLRDGKPDLSYIEAAAEALAPHVTLGACVVLESTTYPGTTEELVAPILEAGSGLTAGDDFSLGYSPERIDPGNQQWTFETTPKVVSGIDAASLAQVDALYSQLRTPLNASACTIQPGGGMLQRTFARYGPTVVVAHGLGLVCRGGPSLALVTGRPLGETLDRSGAQARSVPKTKANAS